MIDVHIVTLTILLTVLALLLYSNYRLGRRIIKFKQREKRNIAIIEQVNHSQKIESVGRLAGGVAHDFNNMVTGIKGAAEFLKLKLGKDSPLLHYTDIIISACQKASNLTSQLLVFSRSKASNCENMDLHQCLNESLYLLEHGIGKKIIIRKHFKAERFYICGSFDLLQNMILNLGFNSKDAMPNGGTISIKTRNLFLRENKINKTTHKVEPGEYIEVLFKDTGSGIPKELQDKIFEPFFTTKKVGEGSGLGLPAVYGIVTENKGTIYLDSSPKGTSFYLYFPIVKINKQLIKPRDKKIKNVSAKVMIVDDEKILLELLKDMLVTVGSEVITISNSLDVVDVYKNNPNIDVVMMDVIMPFKTGVEVYEELKAVNPNVKVIFMSGYTQDSVVADIVKKQSNVDFLSKPYDLADVTYKIGKMLAKK